MIDAVVLFIILASITDEVISINEGHQWCPTKIIRTTECPASNFLYYFECCGAINTECCFHLQIWVLIMLVILAVLSIISLVVALVRFICCQ
uniref:Uncharacterized protein n=1 Tax=Ascaris lumbricoides TaxID=6252 RepID=A0A0M3HRI7_ASCLU